MINSCMPTRWKLKEFLADHDITVYKLAQETDKKISRNSLYNLTGYPPPTRIAINTFDVLIPALRKLTGEKVVISDIMPYEEPQ